MTCNTASFTINLSLNRKKKNGYKQTYTTTLAYHDG